MQEVEQSRPPNLTECESSNTSRPSEAERVPEKVLSSERPRSAFAVPGLEYLLEEGVPNREDFQ